MTAMPATTEQRALLGAQLIQPAQVAQITHLNVLIIIVEYLVHQEQLRILALHAEQIHLMLYAQMVNGSTHAIEQKTQTLAPVRIVTTLCVATTSTKFYAIQIE